MCRKRSTDGGSKPFSLEYGTGKFIVFEEVGMMNRTVLTVVAVALFALSASAGAALINVPDPSFEIPVLAYGGYKDIASSTYYGPWECVSGDAWVDYGYWRANGYPEDLYARSGNNKAYGYEDYIYQILDETFVEGVTYTLSVWAGQPWTDEARGWRLYFTTEEPAVELAVASAEAGLTWAEISLTYTATAADAGKKIGIKMYGDESVSFDDVSLVPEPATLGLLGLGALMLRRKRS
jgi:hypothetical protein